MREHGGKSNRVTGRGCCFGAPRPPPELAYPIRGRAAAGKSAASALLECRSGLRRDCATVSSRETDKSSRKAAVPVERTPTVVHCHGWKIGRWGWRVQVRGKELVARSWGISLKVSCLRYWDFFESYNLPIILFDGRFELHCRVLIVVNM